MGLKIGRFLGRNVRSITGVAGGFLGGGPMGALQAGQGLMAARLARGSQVGIFPNLMPRAAAVDVGDSEVSPVIVPTAGTMGAAGEAVALAGGITRTVALAISRLATRLGIAIPGLGALGRVGMRIWRSLEAFVKAHPALDVIAFLVGLGLTAEEASHFLLWGHHRRRRRRRRGISSRDMRTTRRTMRRLIRFHHDLRAIAGAPGGRRRRAGAPGIEVVRAG